MERGEFATIRHKLGKTQEQMSRLLCISAKAVQSFEQGWRNVPGHVEREMLLLYSLKRLPDLQLPPCWEIKQCPGDWREHCIVWELQARQFCWYLNGTFCQGRMQQSWEEKIKLCRTCEVYRRAVPAIT